MEKNTVRIQNVTLGAGIPKVCVPVMGKDLREWTEAATAAREQADLIELRLDSVSPELDADRVRPGLPALFAKKHREVRFWRRCAHPATAVRAMGTRSDMKPCSLR